MFSGIRDLIDSGFIGSGFRPGSKVCGLSGGFRA